MQLQIECNSIPSQQQSCLTCNRLFGGTARVIACNEQGSYYGEVCPDCLKKGFYWLSDRLDQINQPKQKLGSRQSWSLKTSIRT